ncbi:MAG: hypothetical protein ACP5SH_10455 [Syntrophobacteraceae bacterium]
MDKISYFNSLMARTEQLFYHELSDCAGWKTEFIGVDFIRSRNITGDSAPQIIENCLRELSEAGLIEKASYSIGGQQILLYFKVQGCIHIPKEEMLIKGGIAPYNCPIANMVLDQLIEKLNFESTYVAEMKVLPSKGECSVKCAVFETADKIGNVCDWSNECTLMDDNDTWRTVEC